jgi:prevent-host-death family protein
MTKSVPASEARVPERVGAREAKTRLSELLRLVEAGGEVEILRNGWAVARIVAAGDRPTPTFGMDRGVFEVPDDFDAPLGPTELAAFEG